MFCSVVHFVSRHLRLFDHKCTTEGIKELILFYSNARCVWDLVSPVSLYVSWTKS